MKFNDVAPYKFTTWQEKYLNQITIGNTETIDNYKKPIYTSLIQGFPIDARHLPLYKIERQMFSKYEIEELLNQLENIPYTWKGENPGESGYNITDTMIIPDKFRNLYQSVALSISNNNIWNIALSGIYHALSYKRYEKDSFVEQHVDYEHPLPVKLGIIIMLSEKNEFSGGELIVAGEKVSLSVGDAVFYPGYVVHEVTKILDGKRKVLVGFATGQTSVNNFSSACTA